jgi:sensor c-di-GMP phosphodiesterase-like protein
VIKGVVSLAKRLNLGLIAEGIENGDNAQVLATIGCAQGQGFYFSKPMEADEVERHLETHKGSGSWRPRKLYKAGGSGAHDTLKPPAPEELA